MKTIPYSAGRLQAECTHKSTTLHTLVFLGKTPLLIDEILYQFSFSYIIDVVVIIIIFILEFIDRHHVTLI